LPRGFSFSKIDRWAVFSFKRVVESLDYHAIRKRP